MATREVLGFIPFFILSLVLFSYLTNRIFYLVFNYSIILLIIRERGDLSESKWEVIGVSGLIRYYIFRNIELILSSVYYSGKLCLLIRYILETGGIITIIRYLKESSEYIIYSI